MWLQPAGHVGLQACTLDSRCLRVSVYSLAPRARIFRNHLRQQVQRHAQVGGRLLDPRRECQYGLDQPLCEQKGHELSRLAPGRLRTQPSMLHHVNSTTELSAYDNILVHMHMAAHLSNEVKQHVHPANASLRLCSWGQASVSFTPIGQRQSIADRFFDACNGQPGIHGICGSYSSSCAVRLS